MPWGRNLDGPPRGRRRELETACYVELGIGHPDAVSNYIPTHDA